MSDRTAESHTPDSSHTAVSRIGWRYPEDGDRDLRLDFLRGLCLLKMVFDHLPRTPLHRYLHWTGYVTAAEGFFIISGVVLGIIYRRRVAQKGLAPATRTLWRRAGSVYLSNLVLVLLFACLEVYGALPRHRFEHLWETGGFHWWTLLHLNQPYLLNILPRYVFFLVLAPAAIWLLMHRKGWVLLLASATLWALNLQQLGTIRVPGLEPFKSSFPLVSWQLLFFTGVAMGWHKETMAAWFGALPWRRVLLLATVGTVGFVALRQAIIRDLVTVNDGDKLLLFARRPLGVARLVNITFAFGLIYLLTDRFWKPLASTAGKLLIPFGQRSLYVFLAHCVLFVGCLILGVKHHRPFSVAPWWHLALDLLLIALLWIMVRYRFCFSLVPK